MRVVGKRVVWEGRVRFGRMCRWEWGVLKKKADPEAPFDWPLANTSHQKNAPCQHPQMEIICATPFSFFRHNAQATTSQHLPDLHHAPTSPSRHAYDHLKKKYESKTKWFYYFLMPKDDKKGYKQNNTLTPGQL